MMTTTPNDAVEALELAMRNAEEWHADTQYKAGSKDVAEVCIELLNKSGFTITSAEPAPLPERVEEVLRWLDDKDREVIRAHIAAQSEKLDDKERAMEQLTLMHNVLVLKNSALEAENKRLREALKPFAMAALKYRDIGNSPVAEYIWQKTGLIAGYNMVFMPLCSANTSPKNWFDACDALAQPEPQK